IAAACESADPGAAPCEVREKHYARKDDAKRRVEVHGHTIDLMIAREGAEVIHICPMDRLTPAEALPNGGDGRKLDGTPQGTAVLLEKGYFCAIFPGEAHMVGGKINGEEGFIDKWVVKVPAPDAYLVNI
ncbi:MAG: YhcH/YjgK/YiaL family protein, partial [Oscillospiraceae bacterium]|nr:YhcH/YjgK/YiaL family protein [Oscillospiraceae bacterium]